MEKNPSQFRVADNDRYDYCGFTTDSLSSSSSPSSFSFSCLSSWNKHLGEEMGVRTKMDLVGEHSSRIRAVATDRAIDKIVLLCRRIQ